MRLSEWLVITGTTKSAFARAIGVTPGAMTALCRGTKWVSARVGRAIERETLGAVTVRDLLEAMQLPSPAPPSALGGTPGDAAPEPRQRSCAA
jgi:DNA-binding transcriptional regulator YdaS (Cro superfamily)